MDKFQTPPLQGRANKSAPPIGIKILPMRESSRAACLDSLRIISKKAARRSVVVAATFTTCAFIVSISAAEIPFLVAPASRAAKNVSRSFRFGFCDAVVSVGVTEGTVVGVGILAGGTSDALTPPAAADEIESALSFVLVYNPTYPLPRVSATGANISLAYFS